MRNIFLGCILALLGLSGCASKVKVLDADKKQIDTYRPDAPIHAESLPPANINAKDLGASLKDSKLSPVRPFGDTEQNQSHHAANPAGLSEPQDLSPAPPTSSAKKESHATHLEGVAADVALKWLKNGNHRFRKKLFRSDGRSPRDRQRLSKGQKPHTIVLSCSDSRVPPELVFDQSLGEIFVIRVAGQALDSSVVASIEYATAHLGSQLIVVLGHESCGAVKAALSTPAGHSAGSVDLDRLVADIRPRVSKVARTPLVEDVLVESATNAKLVAQDLLLRSPIIKAKIDSGALKIVPALYYLASGEVDFF